jgi:bifunctional DNA-binding transcriptional regulator/antitoxin component of YhaV-PrlF toxin-antitoxin module
MPENIPTPTRIKEIESIIDSSSDNTKGESTVSSDGKQYLVRIPNNIARAIGTKKGDRLKFEVNNYSLKSGKKREIKIEYIGGK